jgi:hypothetical protein
MQIRQESRDVERTLFKTVDDNAVNYNQDSINKDNCVENDFDKTWSDYGLNYSNDKFIKYNPFMFNPSKIESYLKVQNKYLDYYNRHTDIHKSMVNIKRILVKVFDEIKDIDPANGSSSDFSSLYVEEYNKLVNEVKNIFQNDHKKEDFKSEPYRSASIVIPVGYFGGMSKKIWELERNRFELLMECRDLSPQKKKDLFREYYKLTFLNPVPLASSNKNEKGSGNSIHKSDVDTILKSIFKIMSEFEQAK